MNEDKIEIITDQLNSLKNLWHILRASSIDHSERDACEELLLDIFEIKVDNLSVAVKSK